jgi:hypothetical protein
LIVGLVCLAIINILLLVDIELTLRRNKHDQSPEEDEWGFGQVLALLLLIVPLRDFVTSIGDIRKKVKSEKAAEEHLQKRFKEHLKEAILKDTFYNCDFQGLIHQGADPNAELEGIPAGCSYLTYTDQLPTGSCEFVTLLQFAAYKGNEHLVSYLLERGVEDSRGNSMCTGLQVTQVIDK